MDGAKRLLVSIALLAPLVLLAQTPAAEVEPAIIDASPRVAALRMALKSGLSLPSKLVVAIETAHALPHPPPSSRSSAALAAEARLLATVAGSGARIGLAETFLSCAVFQCYCATEDPVLLVNDVSESGGVLIRLYSPSDRPGADVRLVQGIIDVRLQGDRWEAVGPRRPIQTVYHRR